MPVVEPPAAPPLASAPEPVRAPEPPPSVPGPRPPGHELDGFFEALRGLEKHTRSEHVRMIWLGDSHGAADLWSGRLRDTLQKRFGDGGPGHVDLGYKARRHEGIRVEIKGSWHIRPKGPSTVVPTADGVFGLGGVLAGGYDGAQVTLTVADSAVPPQLGWDFCYKPSSARDEVELRLTGAAPQSLKPAPDALGTLQHVLLESRGASPTLHAAPLAGTPDFCGVTIETDPRVQPGVVLDNLAINGARLATPLAWNEAAWVAELARRSPKLVILEYGTNEAGDHKIRPEAFADNLSRVLARVRRASPGCDCLVLSNTERADAQEMTPQVHEALRSAARASGCMFWDTHAAMGGKGAILRWRAETPPRASSDGIHLTARGYHELGDKLAADLLTAYSSR